MKKLLPLLLLFGFGTAVNAGGMSTRHQSSLQLTVDAARTIQTSCLLYTSDAADD